MRTTYHPQLNVLFIFGILFLFSFNLSAQVGIGTPDPKSTLDIRGVNHEGAVTANDGILVPRVNNLSANGTQDGQLVYLIVNSGTFQKGFHNWNTTTGTWVPVGGSAGVDPGNSWSLTGNVGLAPVAGNPGTNFIGTTNNVGLQIRTNGAARFDFTSNGRLRTLDAGDALFPSYSFNGSNGQNMGMYRAGTGNLGFATDGKQRIKIFNNGQIAVNSLLAYENPFTYDKFVVYSEANGTAIRGQARSGSSSVAVWGENEQGGRGVNGTSRTNTGVGVFGSNTDGTGVGVSGINYGTGNGVEGSAGSNQNAFAVFASGKTGATGVKSFVIDDPRDPANKTLIHFSIESNEVLNLYRGTSTFGPDGSVLVQLPNYYEVINKNPSYQLTPVGAAMPNLHIEKEMANGYFVIAGGTPGKKVSWNVTAERNDPYMQQTLGVREVEIDKGDRRGKYFTPELYGEPKEKGLSYRGPENFGSGGTIKSSEISKNSEEMEKSSSPGDSMQDKKSISQFEK